MPDSMVSGGSPLSIDPAHSAHASPVSPQRWLRLGEAAKLFNVSESFLRKATERKKNPLPHIRLYGDSGERRFNYGDMCRHFRIRQRSDEPVKGEIWLYLRVSSPAQKSSLVNQRAMALEEIVKREELIEKDIVVVEETKSAFSGRDKFNQIIWGIVEQRVRRVYYCYASRWSRVGCLTRLTEFLADKFNVDLVPLFSNDGEAAKETSGYDFQEALDYLQVIVNTQNGMRAAKVNSVVLQEETITAIHRLHRQGTPGNHIQKILEEGGHRSINPPNGVISYYSINKLLNKKKVLDMANPAPPEKNSWQRFADERLVYEGEDSPLRLRKSELYAAYTEFCTAKKLIRLSALKVGLLTKHIPRKYTHSGSIALVGCRVEEE